jgi:aquaporin Z
MNRSRIRWAEYAIEAAGLGAFMVSALAVTALVQHPASTLHQTVASPTARRGLIGVAMGLTAAALIYSPWGQRSGAHLNPSVTLSYLRLGKIKARDAAAYVLAQFAGGAAGIAAGAMLLARVAQDPSVNYVVTTPGANGWAAAFGGELAISFGMMSAILAASNTPRAARFTGALAACLIAVYITVEAPLSGMSMNPARSLGPALASGNLRGLWIYFVAPPLGMLLAAEVYVRRHGQAAIRCAKLHHPSTGSCHFNCSTP